MQEDEKEDDLRFQGKGAFRRGDTETRELEIGEKKRDFIHRFQEKGGVTAMEWWCEEIKPPPDDRMIWSDGTPRRAEGHA